ncbi:DUF6084 family protein [Streptomyces sp. NPDC001380]|uniref:DUF6084 family protein n=1 Tax=Streptomyces sp. NPDC001380 TaxID=3364566 RepID=UPI0036B133D6
MTGLDFACTGVHADRYAAGPTLVFRLRVTAAGGERVHALALRCQIRIEPARRRYSPAEADRLHDLFGGRERWGETLRPLHFAQVSVVVPGFTGETEVDLPVPCTYDMDVASARYFAALEDGEAPLLLLFSGTAFSGPGGFRVHPVPWDREAVCRMPSGVWREAVDLHFPDCGWIRLPRAALDALLAYRSRRALPSWEAAVGDLLDAAGGPDRPAAAPAAAPATASAAPPATAAAAAEGTAP